MSFIIYFSVIKLTPSLRQGMILNNLIVSGYFSSFACTITSTLLIVYQIYNSLSKQETHSKRRFLHTVDVLVQSAAVYSLSLLASAIAGVVLINSGDKPTLSMFAVLNYECSAVLFLFRYVFLVSKYCVKFNKILNQGIAPTIMVARVALATDNIVTMDSMNVHISAL